MDVRFRPYSWIGEQTPVTKKRRSPFSTSWNKTLAKLEYELTKLKATEILIEADFTEAEIRLDGWPRAGARPGYGGVKISFNQPGVGRVEYPCDSCVGWQDNIHSIALGLEALRAVERYGITGRHQQYTGFRALEQGNGDRRGAATWIAKLLRSDPEQQKLIVKTLLTGTLHERKGLIRDAQKHAHPDSGGSRELWELLEEKKARLGL